MKLIPVKYHEKNYPKGIIPQLEEVAGNFDSKKISVVGAYSLHTEYAYMARKFDSALLFDLDELKNSNKNGIPQLWKSTKWGEEFAVFIERLVGDGVPPEVIEIHPPFRDYCTDFSKFIESYNAFYGPISRRFPGVKVLIENRCGTMYSGAQFLLSTCRDILSFCRFLADSNTTLGIIIDYPQLFSAERIKMDNLQLDKILRFNLELKAYAEYVGAIHLWGKQKKAASGRWAPHSGTLDTFFSNDSEKKRIFLDSMISTLSDNIERYFVPEVNTTESDLHSIVNDLVLSGVTFVQKEMQSYLIAIDWSNSIPQFVLGNSFNSSIQKLNAIGKYSINVGTKKYCIGNKDVITHQYLGCPVRAELHDNAKKCPDCERHDYLKYCVRCTGRRCFANRKDVLDRCNQEHFVYLTYFPNDIIKVGVAHSRRKYTRLYEQGAVFSYIIASCPSGEAARKLEDHIRKMGFKDRVTSSYKIHNIASFNEDTAEQKLQAAYQQIVNNSELNEFEKSAIISPPERVTRLEIIELLNGFMPGAPQQLSLWDIIKIEEEKSSVEIMETIDGFQGELVQFIGTIGIIKENKTYKLFDFKPIIGKEFEIKEIRARNSHTP